MGFESANDKKNDKDFLFQFIDSLFYFYNYKEDNQISKIKREKFFDDITIYLDNVDLKKYAESKLRIIIFIENSLDRIKSLRSEHNLYKGNESIELTLSKIILSALDKAYENLQIFNKNYQPPNYLSISDRNTFDYFLSVTSDLITQNLKYLGYKGNLFDNKEILNLKEKNYYLNPITISEKELDFCYQISNMWLFYESRYLEWRKINSEIFLEEVSELLKQNIINDSELNKLKEKGCSTYLKYNNSPLEQYILVAQTRFIRRIMNNFIKYKDKNDRVVELANLCDTLHIELNDKFGKLTVSEWFAHLTILKIEAQQNVIKGSAYKIYKESEFLNLFKSLRIPLKKTKYFIDKISFKKSSIDIFDNPIVRFDDTSILFMNIVFTQPFLPNIFLSLMARNQIDVSKKGTNYEKNLLELFKTNERFGLLAKSKKIKINNEEYEYDCIVVWEEFIFLFELKNRAFPNQTTHSMVDFYEKSESFIVQINRQLKGFKENIKIFNELFGMDLSDKTIVPVILSAFPICFNSDINGVYFYDYSTLSKFFEGKLIGKKNQKTEEIEMAVHSQWIGDSPCARDLFNSISQPFQLLTELEKIETESGLLSFYDLLILKNNINLESFPLVEFK